MTAIDGHGKRVERERESCRKLFVHCGENKNLVLTCLDLLEQFVNPWIPLTFGTDLGRDGFAGCTLCTSPSQLVLGSQRPEHAAIAATCLGSTEGRARKPTGIRNAYNGPTSLKAFCFEVLVRISIYTFWDSAHFGYTHFIRR